MAVETDPGDAVVEASGPRLVPFETKMTLGRYPGALTTIG